VDHLSRDEALPALATAYRDFTGVVTGLDRAGLAGATRCAGWNVLELVCHLLADARRALVAFASPAGAPADVDYATYWRPFRPANDIARATARFVRDTTAAYDRPDIVLHEWVETSAAAVRAAEVCPHEHVTTQGHVLTVPDFIGTLAVEAAVHHLDLLDLPGPAPAPLALVRRTLDGLLPGSPPPSWDDTEYAGKGTGRLPLTDPDRAALGPLATHFPLLG
jgi:uncharacterized protein (TIGR03083 family)